MPNRTRSRRAAFALSASFFVAAACARTGLQDDVDRAPSDAAGSAGAAPVSPADVSGPCPAALLAGAPAPITGYCPTRANETSFQAPAGATPLWSVQLSGMPGPDDTVVVGKAGRHYVRVDTNLGDTAWLPQRLVAVDEGGKVAFQYDADGVINGTPVLAADGSVVILVSKPPSRTVVFLSVTGAVLRSVPVELPIRGEPAVGRDGTFYFLVEDSQSPVRVLALSASGAVRWVSPNLGRFPRQVATGRSGEVVTAVNRGPFGDFGSEVVVTSVGEDGALRWETQLDAEAQLIDGPAVARDGAIYTVLWTQKSTKSTLVVLEPTGAPRARIDVGEKPWGGGVTALSVGSDGAAYVKAGESLIALDRDGHERWRRPAHPNVLLSCTIDGAGSVIVSGGAIEALDPLTGSVAWKLDAPAMAGPVIHAVGGATIGDRKMYFTDFGKTLYAVGVP